MDQNDPKIADAEAEYTDFSAGVLQSDGLPRDGLPVAPGTAGFLCEPEEAPVATEDNCACLRGPCRFFWRIVLTTAGEGNVKGTWDHLQTARPRLALASCLANPGEEMPITADNPVRECNRWSPMVAAERDERARVRAQYETDRKRRDAPLTMADLFPAKSIDDEKETSE